MKVLNFLRVYTIPIVVLLIGFSLYYFIFSSYRGANKAASVAIAKAKSQKSPINSQIEDPAKSPVNSQIDSSNIALANTKDAKDNIEGIDTQDAKGDEDMPPNEKIEETKDTPLDASKVAQKDAEKEPTLPSPDTTLAADEPIAVPTKDTRAEPISKEELVDKIIADRVKSDAMQGDTDEGTRVASTTTPTATPLEALSFRGRGIIKVAALNIRAKPDPESPIIAKLYEGAVVGISAPSSSSTWVHVLGGYTLRRFISISKPSAPIRFSAHGVIIADVLNIRAQKDPNSRVIARLHEGVNVSIDVGNVNDPWIRVLNGYTLRKFIKVVK